MQIFSYIASKGKLRAPDVPQAMARPFPQNDRERIEDVGEMEKPRSVTVHPFLP